jgi:serine/threonine-protein kinase HipA
MYDIYLYDRLVGRLTPRGESVQFTYDAGALTDGAMPAISLSMPKRTETYGGKTPRAFFLNLLPEGAYKRLVAQVSGTSSGNDQALLGAIGGECPGAIAIWPEHEKPPAVPGYEPLTDNDLLRLFDPKDPTALAVAMRRARLSLAGMQDKIALYRDDAGQWFRPIDGATTSHILKQAAARFPEILENELFCMTLAADADLHVATVDLASPNVRVFCTERFDRPKPGSPSTLSRPRQKLHQEDFCQILSVLPDKKYQDEGGPSLKACARVVHDHSSLPVEDLVRLLNWVGFNYLIGNEDAHAKNLAMLYHPRGLRLAPYYDLVSTEVYGDLLERGCAMKIGRAWDLRAVQANDWVRTAEMLQLGWPVARAELLRLIDRVQGTLATTMTASVQRFGSASIYRQVGALVQQRCATLARELARRQ